MLPMPISPVASSCTPAAFCARTSPMPAAMASTACWRVMAGPVVKSAVPAAMRQFCTPGTGSPAMPRSTGTTSQRAVFAIWQTLVRRAARFSATARVTLWSVWLTPCATTPLSAQSTSTARRENASSAVPVRAAASSSMVSSLPSPPSGLARLAQWAWAAVRAVSSGRVILERSCFSSSSVIDPVPLDDSVRRHPRTAGAEPCPPNTNAGSPHRNARLQSRSPIASRWALRR